MNIASSVKITLLLCFTAFWIYSFIVSIFAFRIRGSSYLKVFTYLKAFLLILYLEYIFLIWLGLILTSPNFQWNRTALSDRVLFAHSFNVSILIKYNICAWLSLFGLPLDFSQAEREFTPFSWRSILTFDRDIFIILPIYARVSWGRFGASSLCGPYLNKRTY